MQIETTQTTTAKKVFSIQLHRRGDLNDAIVRMITNHNEGNVEIDISYFPAYGRAKFAEWPTVTPKFEFKHDIGEGKMEVWENDKHTLTIEEKEVYELAPVLIEKDIPG